MTRKIASNVLTTTATGTQQVLSYTVPSGYTFKLYQILIGVEPTTWTTDELHLGYIYVNINGVDYLGIQARGMQGDVTGIYGSRGAFPEQTGSFAFPLPIFEDVEFNSGETITIYASPATTTSTRWRATIIGDEIPPAVVETIIAKDFPMLYLSKPVKAQELISKVEATITKIAKDYPEALLKSGKAAELKSKFTT
jgi:hypothetical protein